MKFWLPRSAHAYSPTPVAQSTNHKNIELGDVTTKAAAAGPTAPTNGGDRRRVAKRRPPPPSRSRLEGSWDWTILLQSKVRPVLIMVFNVRPEDLTEVVFTEGDDMVQQLSSEGAIPSLADSVLPRTSDACPRRLRTEGLDRPINGRGQLGVVVVDEVFSRHTRYIVASEAKYTPRSARFGTSWLGGRSRNSSLLTTCQSFSAPMVTASNSRGPSKTTRSAACSNSRDFNHCLCLP